MSSRLTTRFLNLKRPQLNRVEQVFTGHCNRGVELRQIGGAKLKSGGQRFSPKCEGFFWPKTQIFRPKAGELKKKVFAEIRRLFLAEIANFNVFSTQKHQLLPPKKYRGGARKKSKGQKRKSGGHCLGAIGGALTRW